MPYSAGLHAPCFRHPDVSRAHAPRPTTSLVGSSECPTTTPPELSGEREPYIASSKKSLGIVSHFDTASDRGASHVQHVAFHFAPPRLALGQLG